MTDKLTMKVVKFRIQYYAALGFGALATVIVLCRMGLFNNYAALGVLATVFTFILCENSILRSCLSKQEWSEWQR